MRSWKLACWLGLATVCGYLARDAFAAGPPTTVPLVFRGVLSEGGTAVNSQRSIVVTLYDSDTSTVGLCASNPSPLVQVTNGAFKVDLPASCTPVVEGNPSLWAEVTVGGTPLPRTRVTAVPFALEAKNALNATGAAGDLRVELDGKLPRSAVPIFTDWAAYPVAPVLSYRDNGQTVEYQTTVGVWRREGDSVHVRLYTNFTNAPLQNGQFMWTLPSGKVPNDILAPAVSFVGGGLIGRSGNVSLPITVFNVAGHITGMIASGGLDRLSQGGVIAGTFIYVDALVPVDGWTTTTGATL